MRHSTNFNLNMPELSDQYCLNHWNENTEILDRIIKEEIDDRESSYNELKNDLDDIVNISNSEIDDITEN